MEKFDNYINVRCGPYHPCSPTHSCSVGCNEVSDFGSKYSKFILDPDLHRCSFTGSFSSWSNGRERKDDPEIETLRKVITTLQGEIAEIKGKIALYCGGGDVGVTATVIGLLGYGALSVVSSPL
jgi:hypothetical protein